MDTNFNNGVIEMDTFIFSKEFEDVLKRCILGVLEEFHTKKTISGGQRGI